MPDGNRTIICGFCLGKAALQNVSVDEKIYGIRIARIERNRCGEIAFRFRPLTTPTFDVTGQRKKRNAVRKMRARQSKFLQRSFVIAMATKLVISHRDMRLGKIGTEL